MKKRSVRASQPQPQGTPLGGQFRHHVVPQAWQKVFSATGRNGEMYYQNVLTRRKDGPVGPINRMKEDYANILFDAKGFALKNLEDRLGSIETRLMPVLKSVLSTNEISPDQRGDIAELIAVQALRYPEYYEKKLDRGREMAIELESSRCAGDLASFNARMHQMFPSLKGASFTQEEFDNLVQAPSKQVKAEVEEIVYGHLRSIDGLNPNTIIDAAKPSVGSIAGYNWELIASCHPDFFILSDRPVPETFTRNFSVVLGPALALKVDSNLQGSPTSKIVARQAQTGEVAAINSEATARAQKWLCASTKF